MTTQGKQFQPADAKADAQGLLSPFMLLLLLNTSKNLYQTKTDNVQIYSIYAFCLGVYLISVKIGEMCVKDCRLKARLSFAVSRGSVTFLLSSGHPWQSSVKLGTCDRNAERVGQSNHRSADTSVSAGSCANSRPIFPQVILLII